LRAWAGAARLALVLVAAATSAATYSSRLRTTALRQLYFTVGQVFLPFVLFSALLSIVITTITIDTAREFGLGTYALELVFRVLVLEMLPLLTAFFVALRSGSAIGTEVALMRVSGELDDMRAAGIDPVEREFLPRVLASAVSVLSLTIISVAMALVAAYFSMYGFSPWGFGEFTRSVALVFTPPQLAGFALKTLVFGVAVAVIPIAAGLGATRELKSAPVAVLGGMVRLFFALGLIEVLSLAIEYV
jgi:phospholipid/cholesterol/gamma-HCH transport system permease protein